MLLTQDKFNEINEKVAQTVNKLNSIYKFAMSIPNIHYDVRGTNAGLAKHASMSVHFNAVLASENWDDFINNTVPHEVCHIAVWHWASYFKKPIPSAHGPRWKIMMIDVGLYPKRTHDYDVVNVKKETKKYEYKCACSTPIEISSVIHNRILKGKIYRCKKCRSQLSNGSLKISKGFSRPSPNGTTKTRI